jgi:hypothetical protein
MLTLPFQEPATTFNARAQSRYGAKQITNDKFSIFNFQFLALCNFAPCRYHFPLKAPRPSLFSTLIPNDRHPPDNTQLIAPKPLATQPDGATISTTY